MIQYKLSIDCIDGDTVYIVISSSKKLLLNFLNEHDHEGSTIYLEMKDGTLSTEIGNPEEVYKELGKQ